MEQNQGEIKEVLPNVDVNVNKPIVWVRVKLLMPFLVYPFWGMILGFVFFIFVLENSNTFLPTGFLDNNVFLFGLGVGSGFIIGLIIGTIRYRKKIKKISPEYLLKLKYNIILIITVIIISFILGRYVIHILSPYETFCPFSFCF